MRRPNFRAGHLAPLGRHERPANHPRKGRMRRPSFWARRLAPLGRQRPGSGAAGGGCDDATPCDRGANGGRWVVTNVPETTPQGADATTQPRAIGGANGGRWVVTNVPETTPQGADATTQPRAIRHGADGARWVVTNVPRMTTTGTDATAQPRSARRGGAGAATARPAARRRPPPATAPRRAQYPENASVVIERAFSSAGASSAISRGGPEM